jgi:hypothetical protein
MRDRFCVAGNFGDELHKYNKRAEEEQNEPEQAQAKNTQGQDSGGLAGAIRARSLA